MQSIQKSTDLVLFNCFEVAHSIRFQCWFFTFYKINLRTGCMSLLRTHNPDSSTTLIKPEVVGYLQGFICWSFPINPAAYLHYLVNPVH